MLAGRLRRQFELSDLVRVAGFFLCETARRSSSEPRPGVAEDRVRTSRSAPASPFCCTSGTSLLAHCSGVPSTEVGCLAHLEGFGHRQVHLGQRFLERGYKILADDMLALTFDDQGRAMALARISSGETVGRFGPGPGALHRGSAPV